MRVERVELLEVTLPLIHSFETSSHRKSALQHILVRATDADGREGWGEIASPADPYFTSETTDTAWLIATRYLAPMILGVDWEEPSELEASWSRIRGHEFAKAGFSAAAWDLHARAWGRSLAEDLGGTRAEIIAGVSLGIEATLDELLAQVEQQVSAGYARVKLKIAPGWDEKPVEAVRSHYPRLDIHVDANGAYPDTADSAETFRRLDQHGLTMIEQPFASRDFLAHARLQQHMHTPICLDESVVELADLRTMIELDAGRVLNIKVSRMGGLSNAQRAHDLALDAGIPVWCGGMHEFGIGRAANVAISSLSNFTLPSDVSASDKYYARDVIVPAVTALDGVVTVPDAPGIGYDVDIDWIRQNTVRTAVFPADAPTPTEEGSPS